MNNGLCKYFDNKNSLDQHYIKSPSRRNVNFSKCKEEAARRVQLRAGSYSNYLDHGSKQTNYSDREQSRDRDQTNYSDRDRDREQSRDREQTNYSERDREQSRDREQTNYSDRDRVDAAVKKLTRKKGSTSTPAPSSSPPRKSPTPTFRKSPTPTFRKSPTPTFRK